MQDANFNLLIDLILVLTSVLFLVGIMKKRANRASVMEYYKKGTRSYMMAKWAISLYGIMTIVLVVLLLAIKAVFDIYSLNHLYRTSHTIFILIFGVFILSGVAAAVWLVLPRMGIIPEAANTKKKPK